MADAAEEIDDTSDADEPTRRNDPEWSQVNKIIRMLEKIDDSRRPWIVGYIAARFRSGQP